MSVESVRKTLEWLRHRQKPFMRSLILASCILIFGAASSAILPTIRFSRPLATADFVEYYAGAKMLLAGGNPYDLSGMKEAQTVVHGEDYPLVIMFSPPHTLALFAPLLVMPFKLSALIFLLVSAAATVAGLFAMLSLIRQRNDADKWIPALTVMSYPVAYGLAFGNVSALFPFAAGGLIYWWRKGSIWKAALCFFILASKPHLAAPAFLLLLIHALKERRLSGFIQLCVPAVCVAALIELWRPGIHFSWLGVLQQHPASTGMPTVLYPLGVLLPETMGPMLRRVAVPAFLSIALAAIYMVRLRRNSFELLFLEVMPLTVFFSACGHVHDYSSLALLQSALGASLIAQSRRLPVLLLAGANILPYFVGDNFRHPWHFLWFPVLFFIFYAAGGYKVLKRNFV